MPKKRVEKKIFSLDDLKPKKHYRIKVKSFNKDKKLIGESPWVIFKTTGKNQAPPNVTNLDADFKGSTLVITWDGSAARAEKDFKEFRIKITSPDHPGVSRNFYDKDDKFNFNEDLNRKLFGTFEGTIQVTVYSRDRSDNESSGVSITAYAEIPEDPTNVRLTAAAFGYNVSWDLPTFKNYDYTRIYESSSQSGTYNVVRTERGASAFVSKNNFTPAWIKVSHVNKAGAESNLVASIPPSIIPLDPGEVDVTPPDAPTNLNWEAVGTEDINGITTATMRAHWEVTDITSGYKVRVTEDITNKTNWAVYDVPASKATVTAKQILSNVATLTVTAHSFAVDDYITVFGLGPPFDGKKKVTAVTSTTVSFSQTNANVSQTLDDGSIVISSYTVKELYPGTPYLGSILAYDSANNLSQFLSEGQFLTPGSPGVVGTPIKIEGTTMAFGPNVSGTNDGLFINNSNYWYNTGNINIGSNLQNSLSWNGNRLRIDGGITARSGIFSGNIFILGTNAEENTSASSAGIVITQYYSIQSASWSSGTATIILQSIPNPAWAIGDVIIVAQASRDFDGQYVINSVSGNTITFPMSADSGVVPSITNVGSVARVSERDRITLNAAGIHGYDDGQVVFSLNRNRNNRIGGWSIKPARLSAGSGTDFVGLASSGTYRIWAGNADADLATFRLTGGGNLSIQQSGSSARVIVGANLSGTFTGLLIDDSATSGISNFWYLPSTVGTNENYFRVGTTNGSAITVQKLSGGASKVTIKDYEIEGDTVYNPGAKQSFGGILIGRDIDGSKDGIKLNNNNYWYRSNSDSNSQPDFKVGNGTKSMQFDTTTGLLKIIGGDISLTGGGVIKTSDSNTRVIMDSNGLYGYKAGTPTFSINAATGDAEFAGKVKKNATIGTSRIGIRDVDSGDAYPGLDIGSTLSINAGVDDASGTASIVFVRTGTTIVEGSIFPITATKTASLEYGLGIGVANSYPILEVGWTDSARTSPRIRLSGSATSRLEVGASRFVLEGNNTSRINIPVITGTATKYLGRINGNNEISWVDAPEGGGTGKTYTSGDSSEGIIVNNTNDTIRNAGYRKVGTTNLWTETRTNERNRITFGATRPGTGDGRSDGDIHIEF